MTRVLGATQTRFDQSEPGLHEHDQKPGDQSPHEVNRDPIVAHCVGEFHRQRFELGLSGIIVECLFGIVVRLDLGGIFFVCLAQIRRGRCNEASRG